MWKREIVTQNAGEEEFLYSLGKKKRSVMMEEFVAVLLAAMSHQLYTCIHVYVDASYMLLRNY